MSDRKLPDDYSRCNGHSEKKRGLFGELWHFISGEWVAEARASERERMEQPIAQPAG